MWREGRSQWGAGAVTCGRVEIVGRLSHVQMCRPDAGATGCCHVIAMRATSSSGRSSQYSMRPNGVRW